MMIMSVKPPVNLAKSEIIYECSFIRLFLLVLDGVGPLMLLLAEHNSLEPGLDLRGISSRLAVGTQGADISVLVTDHGNGGDKVLRHDVSIT